MRFCWVFSVTAPGRSGHRKVTRSSQYQLRFWRRKRPGAVPSTLGVFENCPLDPGFAGIPVRVLNSPYVVLAVAPDSLSRSLISRATLPRLPPFSQPPTDQQEQPVHHITSPQTSTTTTHTPPNTTQIPGFPSKFRTQKTFVPVHFAPRPLSPSSVRSVTR